MEFGGPKLAETFTQETVKKHVRNGAISGWFFSRPYRLTGLKPLCVAGLIHLDIRVDENHWKRLDEFQPFQRPLNIPLAHLSPSMRMYIERHNIQYTERRQLVGSFFYSGFLSSENIKALLELHGQNAFIIDRVNLIYQCQLACPTQEVLKTLVQGRIDADRE